MRCTRANQQRLLLSSAMLVMLPLGLAGCGMFGNDRTTTAELVERAHQETGGGPEVQHVEISGSTPSWNSGSSSRWHANDSSWSAGGQRWSTGRTYKPSVGGFSSDSFGNYKLQDQGISDE